MSQIYYDIIRNRVVAAVGAAEALSSITHPGLKGQLRELVVRELLSPLLPADIGVGTGQIISASGRSWSGQEDIVIYDRRLLPPVLFEGSTGVFPVESVLFTIEVKSVLNATELKKAHDAAVTLRDFDYVSGCQTATGTVHHVVEKVISTVFAFKTDLTGKEKTELSRYQEICPNNPALRAICVPGSGYWFYAESEWKPSCDNDKYGMVVRFLAGIMSVYRRVIETRRQPSLSEYLRP